MKKLELKTEDVLSKDGNALSKEERIKEILKIVAFEEGDCIILNGHRCDTEKDFRNLLCNDEITE